MFASFLAAAALTPPQDRTVQSATDEIVVVGERVRRIKLVTKTDKKTGRKRCVVKRRSGDAAFDQLMCDAVLTCAKTAISRRQMETCTVPYLDRYARMLAERRVLATSTAADR